MWPSMRDFITFSVSSNIVYRLMLGSNCWLYNCTDKHWRGALESIINNNDECRWNSINCRRFYVRLPRCWGVWSLGQDSQWTRWSHQICYTFLNLPIFLHRLPQVKLRSTISPPHMAAKLRDNKWLYSAFNIITRSENLKITIST